MNVFLGLGMPWSIAAIYWNFFPSDGQVRKWRNRYGDRDGEPASKGQRGAKTIGENRGVAFVVPAGDLALSVMVFVCCGITCLGLLAYRRRVYGAELGGPAGPAKRHAYMLLGLWLIYVACSAASTIGII